MSKKKTSGNSSSVFSHTPFSALKGFASSYPSSKTSPPQSSGKLSAGHVDDDALFRRAMSGVRQRDGGKDLQGGPASSASSYLRQKEHDDRSLFLTAMQGITAKTVFKKDEGAGPGRRSQPTRARQLRRGDVSISAELDLHGFGKEDALFRLEHFLTSSAAKGFPSVLVITGKGANSPDGPVLRQSVARWLRERGRGLVAEFASAPPDRGGSGAFVVFLRKRS